MGETWVINASPLITLAKIGRVDLLFSAGRTVLVPESVANEIRCGRPDDPARVLLDDEPRLEVRPARSEHDITQWALGAGESGVLSLSRESGALAILDDREARTAARTLGIRVSGTLGVVVQAARSGQIQGAAPVLRALKKAGLRLSDAVIADALRRFLQESWSP